MNTIRSERGIALVTALMLTSLCLVIILALLYIVSQGTKVSAANKRYRSALEASYGGAEVFTKELIPQLLGVTSTTSLAAILTGNEPAVSDATCVKSKLEEFPAQWVCGADALKVDPKTAPDVTFQLKGQAGQPNFNIYAKIIDTQKGNSDTSGMELLDSAAGVAYGAAGVSPQHMPATYRIEIQGERATNPQEKAALSVLYVY